MNVRRDTNLLVGIHRREATRVGGFTALLGDVCKQQLVTDLIAVVDKLTNMSG